MPQLFVVDPCFKEQFQLPNATPEYNALWQDLPNLFVGTAEQLVPIVELMCTEVRLAAIRGLVRQLHCCLRSTLDTTVVIRQRLRGSCVAVYNIVARIRKACRCVPQLAC
jgi:hypothetical protein